MKILCENYEACKVDLIEYCPHKIPHDKDDLCNIDCHFSGTKDSICREIILKKD